MNEKGAIGLADSLVQTEKRYSNVGKAMLGRIAVIDTIDNAVKIARKYDYGVRYGYSGRRTSGAWWCSSVAVAFKNNSNLLGRRREMEELEKRVAQSKQAMEAAKAALEEMRQKRNDLRKSIEEEKAALQELFIKQNTARMNVVTAQERKAEAEQGYGDLKSEELEIDRKQEQINQDKEAIDQELQISQEQEKESGTGNCPMPEGTGWIPCGRVRRDQHGW